MSIDIDAHVIQRIEERLHLRHLWDIEIDEEGCPQAYATPMAATSIWRVVQAAVREAGGAIVRLPRVSEYRTADACGNAIGATASTPSGS